MKILHRVFQNSHTRRDWFFGKSSYMGKTPCVWAMYWGSFLWEKIEFVLEKSLYWKISLCVRSELWCVESLKFFKDHLCVWALHCEIWQKISPGQPLQYNWKIHSTPQNTAHVQGNFWDSHTTHRRKLWNAKLSNAGPTHWVFTDLHQSLQMP